MNDLAVTFFGGDSSRLNKEMRIGTQRGRQGRRSDASKCKQEFSRWKSGLEQADAIDRNSHPTAPLGQGQYVSVNFEAGCFIWLLRRGFRV